MATYTSNYGWTKPSGSDNVDISVLNNNLDDQDSTIHDAFLNMAPPFSESSTYAVDDIVLYGTGLYKCHTAVVTPGSWTGSTNWQVYKLSEGGGGTYAELPDKPSINGVTLSGNKTASDLGLQDELTFDNVPTDGSNNPVKSDGIYDALASKSDKTATATGETLSLVPTSEGRALLHTAYGMSTQDGTPTPSSPVDIVSAEADFRSVGKNLIPYPYDYIPATIFSTEDDGTIVMNGSTSNRINCWLVGHTGGDFWLSSGTYKIIVNEALDNVKWSVSVNYYNDNSWISAISVATGEKSVTFTVDTSSTTYNIVSLCISAFANSSFSNFKLKVMVVKDSVNDTTYEPYKKTDLTTNLTLRAIEVTSTDDYNLVRDNKYYIADTLDYSEDNGFVVTRRIGHIASYDSESITTKWMSSKDVYASGTYPSAGAVVDYILTSETTETITTAQALALLGLKTYDESTTISSQAEPACTVAVEYAKERLGALALTAYNTAKGNDIRITALEA